MLNHEGDTTEENEITNSVETGQRHLTGRFTSAVAYTHIIHIERRKGTGIPYMAHLLGVAALIPDHG